MTSSSEEETELTETEQTEQSQLSIVEKEPKKKPDLKVSVFKE